jgi:dihydrofolate reductase
MRKIVAGLFISLDGVVEAPQEWQMDLMDDEAGADIQRGLDEADTILLGRRTFEEFASFWPNADPTDPFAAYINDTPKLVASNTLTSSDWKNTSFIGGDVAGKLAVLKRQPGKNLGITGSPTLVRTLLQAGVLDELRLQVYPVVVGKGKRLFDDSLGKLPLRLVDSRITPRGIAILHYQPA